MLILGWLLLMGYLLRFVIYVSLLVWHVMYGIICVQLVIHSPIGCSILPLNSVTVCLDTLRLLADVWTVLLLSSTVHLVMLLLASRVGLATHWHLVGLNVCNVKPHTLAVCFVSTECVLAAMPLLATSWPTADAFASLATTKNNFNVSLTLWGLHCNVHLKDMQPLAKTWIQVKLPFQYILDVKDLNSLMEYKAQ